MLATLEQKGLFVLTRILAYLCILTLAGGFVLCALAGFKAMNRTYESHISPEASIRELQKVAVEQEHQKNDEKKDSMESLAEMSKFKIPAALTDIAARPGGREAIWGFISDIPAGEQQKVLDNIGQVVVLADKNGINRLPAVQTFLRSYRADEAAQRAFESESHTLKLYLASAAISILGLIALFSLVLVLLAIERNTR